MRVAIVSAHPDDETLGAGGAILKHIERGDEIYWILITYPTNNKEIEKVEKYINNINQFYKYKNIFKLKFPVGKLNDSSLSESIPVMRKIFLNIKPEIVYTVSDCDVHSDHLFSYKSVMGALKPFAKINPSLILKYEVLSSTNIFPSKHVLFTPQLFLDITDVIDRKIEAFKIFSEEIQELPYFRNEQTIRALARVRGANAGILYAEAFEVVSGRLECFIK